MRSNAVVRETVQFNRAGPDGLKGKFFISSLIFYLSN